MKNRSIYFIAFLVFGFSLHASLNPILFESDFETGLTLVERPVSPRDTRLFLIASADLRDWPNSRGEGWIYAPAYSSPEKFTYQRRKENILHGLNRITRQYPRYAQVSNIGLNEWEDVHRTHVSLVCPGLHGNGAARIDFKDPGHVVIRKTHTPRQDLFGRFYIRISKDAFDTIPNKLAWFFQGERFRIGIRRIEDDPTPFLAFRFHENEHIKDMGDVYLTSQKPFVPEKDYLLEFHFREGDSINGGAWFRVNDELVDSSFGHNTFRDGLGTSVSAGVFSWARFIKGHMIIDDVVLSTRRIGPLPPKPKILMPGFRFASAFSPVTVHLMITEHGHAWFLNTFNSGIIQATDGPILPNVPLPPDKNYIARLKVQNEFGAWSPWSAPQRFTLKEPLRPGPEGFRLPPVLWLSMPGKSRKLDQIIPGQWYDLHIRFDPEKGTARISRIEVILNHFSNNRASFLSQGHFDETSNYYFSFVPGKKTAWFIIDPRYQPAEISKQKHEYFDDSEDQYRVDLKKGQIKARIRISSNALLGPWTLKGFAVEGKVQNSPLFTTPIIVVTQERKPERSFLLVFILLIAFLIIGIVLFTLLRQRSRKQITGEAKEEAVPKSLVGHAIKIINERINDSDLGMEKVAEELNISRNYLSKQFKKETGQSFPEYLNNQRLQKAKDLLKNTTLSISEIAYQCGYNSLEYFNRVFKDREKCTPRDFRTR